MDRLSAFGSTGTDRKLKHMICEDIVAIPLVMIDATIRRDRVVIATSI